MIPQLLRNVFIINEPLHYTINVSQPTIINLPISTVTIDETWFVPTIWNIQFSGMLSSSATLAAEITYAFSLFKVGDMVPITTFNYVQTLASPNIPHNSSVFLQYALSGTLPENTTDYRLELINISSDAASAINLTISSGTIIGYVIPQI